MNVRTLVNTAYAAIREGWDTDKNGDLDDLLEGNGQPTTAVHPAFRKVPHQPMAMMQAMGMEPAQ